MREAPVLERDACRIRVSNSPVAARWPPERNPAGRSGRQGDDLGRGKRAKTGRALPSPAEPADRAAPARRLQHLLADDIRDGTRERKIHVQGKVRLIPPP